VQIPLHELIRKQRHGRGGKAEQLVFRLWGWAWSDAKRYQRLAALLRWVAAPFRRGGYLKWAPPGPLAEWHAGRDFPAPAAVPFHRRWADLEQEVEE
jgi:hypothetical protein